MKIEIKVTNDAGVESEFVFEPGRPGAQGESMETVLREIAALIEDTRPREGAGGERPSITNWRAGRYSEAQVVAILLSLGANSQAATQRQRARKAREAQLLDVFLVKL